MITIDRTTPYKPTQRTTTAQPLGRTTIVESDSAGKKSRIPVVDRRKNRDRRRQQEKILLESRSGKDRRRNPTRQKPSIDIKA